MSLAITLTFGMYVSLAAAQTSSQMNMPGMKMSGAGASSMASTSSSASSATKAGTSSQAFQAADATMMHRMSAPYSGDTDRDFVEHMMPHHEGAVAMARIELQYGKDPALKKMARDIIQSQNEEIVFMKQWQKDHPPHPAK